MTRCATGRQVSFEYALIAGVNDSAAQGDALGRRRAALRLPAGGPGAHGHAIPLNPIGVAGLSATSALAVRRFRAGIVAHGIPVSIRANCGRRIAAACGQLRAKTGRAGRRPVGAVAAP